MSTTWKIYLLSHKDRAEYDENADHIQLIIDPKDPPATSFMHLSDHPTLVSLTKSVAGKEVQATFLHTVKKASLLATNHAHLALAGFGKRACAMRIDIKEMFKCSTSKKKFPSFNQIMGCTNVQDILDLRPNATFAEEDKLEFNTILPPFLLEILFSDDSMEAEDVLERFVVAIQFFKTQRNAMLTESDLDEDNDMDEGEIANASPFETAAIGTDETTGETDAESPPAAEAQPSELEPFDDADRLYEKRFGRVLRFLWSLVHHGDNVKPTRLSPCSRASTEKWLEEVHEKYLQGDGPPLPPFLPVPSPMQIHPVQDGTGLNNAATAIHKLSDIWGRKIELEEKEKEDREQKKKDKAFDNLSDVQQKVFMLITATSDSTDEDIDQMKPTEDMLKILELKVGIKAQAHLQHEFSKHKLMCDVGLAMSTQMKNGIIMSHPSVNDINGMSPFFLPDTAGEERISSDLALRLEEQLVLGKINETDLKTITKCKIHFAKNFGEYCHMVKNFHRLIVIVAGQESIFAQKISGLQEHARDHERCYKDLEKDNYYFYASVLDHVHRRSQHYIHSASFGLVSKLKQRKLDFADMLDEIEDGDYIPVKPKWLKTSPPANKKRDSGHSFGDNNEQDSPNQNNQRKKKKTSVENTRFDKDLKCPQELQYRSVFHPANRRGIEEVKHEDGSTRCNNWFHRGWCTDTCPLKESHEKCLTATEKIKCKDYLSKLVTKHKKWNNHGQRNENPRSVGQ